MPDTNVRVVAVDIAYYNLGGAIFDSLDWSMRGLQFNAMLGADMTIPGHPVVREFVYEEMHIGWISRRIMAQLDPELKTADMFIVEKQMCKGGGGAKLIGGKTVPQGRAMLLLAQALISFVSGKYPKIIVYMMPPLETRNFFMHGTGVYNDNKQASRELCREFLDEGTMNALVNMQRKLDGRLHVDTFEAVLLALHGYLQRHKIAVWAKQAPPYRRAPPVDPKAFRQYDFTIDKDRLLAIVADRQSHSFAVKKAKAKAKKAKAESKEKKPKKIKAKKETHSKKKSKAKSKTGAKKKKIKKEVIVLE